MRRDFFAFFVAVFCIFNLNSQCASWIQEDFDSFEYASICPFLISGTVMHMSPQGAAYGGLSHSGSNHLYLNFVNNFTGVVFSRPYPVCVGGSYQISFYHREALGGTNNTTFNIYDANNVLLSSENVPWSGNLWNHYVSPSILATTPSLRLEIVNNQTFGNNDMVIDDMSIAICGVQEQLNYTFCSQQTPLDLYNLFSSNMPPGGVWSGPSSLSNGGAGTFDPTSNSLGVYSYSAPG
ncbi:hypothetical protein OAU25_01240 [Crocinitomicaceae bacterium]|nr:hypothetical protein [Crocinitomicaceae bacterium]